MELRTVSWKNNRAVLIDQTRLPDKLVMIQCTTPAAVWKAIKDLKVRGAPAIGAAAALGLYLGVRGKKFSGYLALRKKIDSTFNYLNSARPTAVNLRWALERMRRTVEVLGDQPVDRIEAALLQEALKIMEDDRRCCREMARQGQVLIANNDRVLTYCNTGILATVDYGTALGVLYRAAEQGKKLKVFACETRPLLQGARLTSWELSRKGLDPTLICDNTAGWLMRRGMIDKVFIGADRIAANGDAANKIGSYSLAVLARSHKISFYVVAPQSTFDQSLKTGDLIPIEQRDPGEVRRMFFKKSVAPAKVKILNFAFDVVPARLITAIVTDQGIIRPPYVRNIRSCLS